MCKEALKVILDRLAPALAYNTSIVALDNEKSRYFMIYEIVKEISRLGNRLMVTVKDNGSLTEEVTGEQPEGTEMVEDTVIVYTMLLISFDICLF